MTDCALFHEVTFAVVPNSHYFVKGFFVFLFLQSRNGKYNMSNLNSDIFHQKSFVHWWQAPKSIRTRVGFHAVIITALPMVLWPVPGQTLSHVQEEIQEGRREVSDWDTSPQERWKDISCWVWAYCLLKCCGCNRECWSFNKNSVSLCQAWP